MRNIVIIIKNVMGTGTRRDMDMTSTIIIIMTTTTTTTTKMSNPTMKAIAA